MRYTPRFYQMNGFIKIYIYICGCDIKNFQSFLYWFSIHEMSHFCDFLGPYILLRLWPEAICNKKNTVSEKYFKILNFGSSEMQLKFTVLFHIGAQLTAGKPKILLKTKISAKTASLGIINDVSPRKIAEFLDI